MRNQQNALYGAMTHHVLTVAEDEATAFNHPYIGAEHLLLAILRDSTSAAAGVLSDAGVTYEVFRGNVMDAVGRGSMPVEGYIGPTPRVQRILELAAKEAPHLGDGAGDTRLLLYTFLVDGGGLATRILSGMGMELRNMADDAAKGLWTRARNVQVPVPASRDEQGMPWQFAARSVDTYVAPAVAPLPPWRAVSSRHDG